MITKEMVFNTEKELLLNIIKKEECLDSFQCCSTYMMEDGTNIIIECPLIQYNYCTITYEEDYYYTDSEDSSDDIYEYDTEVLNKCTHIKEAALKIFLEHYGTEEELFGELL